MSSLLSGLAAADVAGGSGNGIQWVGRTLKLRKFPRAPEISASAVATVTQPTSIASPGVPSQAAMVTFCPKTDWSHS